MTAETIMEQELRNKIKSVANKGCTVEESQRSYIEWAETYDKDVLQNGYSSHIAVSKMLCDYISKDKRSEVRVLDVGAGTGLVAKLLRDEGFTNIDALDPSQAMLDEAKKDNLYKRYIVDYITGSPLDIPANSYDAITGSGIFVEGAHVPTEAVIEMVRLVKPGGLVSLISRCNVMEPGAVHENLETLMQKLVHEKQWELLSRATWSRYYMDNDAVVWCYRVL